MLSKGILLIGTKSEIARLHGGRKRDCRYFIGILAAPESNIVTDVLELRLQAQMASQKSPRFPEGYELFTGCYGRAEFCLRAMTISVPRLKLYQWGGILTKERKPACVFLTRGDTEPVALLQAEARASAIRHRIRTHAAKGRERLAVVLSLMTYSGAPICSDPANWFEAYLAHRTPEFLEHLLELLDMPEPGPTPPALELPQAA